MHALIVGDRGVGKSTLIRRVLKELNRPVWGFETKKEEQAEDAIRGCPIYIYDAGKPHVRSPGTLIGYHREQNTAAITDAFERYAPKLLLTVPENAVVELDEIGFLEARSETFCRAVMRLLDGSRPVIAAVKNKDIPFLRSLRSHPNARCFYITPENRDALFEEVLDFMKLQLEENQ
jgi:nucleoside-triphosphatase